ncbi:hypothetical protein GW17_00030693 [Ensete ventricosum]|nr:hypothetical protein GW17_00030693 [Ensete ventricosum]
MAWLPARGGRLRQAPLQGAATRGHDRLRPTLPPAGAAAPAAGVVAPWKGDCRPQRAAATCVGAAWERGGYSGTHDAVAGDHNAW